jgi:hypothetical protein
LFSKHGIFRSGQLDLRLEEAGQGCSQPDKPPASLWTKPTERSSPSKMRGSHLKDLLKKEKLYKERFIDRVGWLDRITFSRLEEIKQQVELA